jgi:hypothetical protein
VSSATGDSGEGGERWVSVAMTAGRLWPSTPRENHAASWGPVAVVSELEQLESRAKRDADALSELVSSASGLAEEASKHAKEAQRAASALATRRRRLDETIAEGKISGKIFANLALDHQRALVHAEACTKAATKAQAALLRDPLVS